MSDLRTSSTPPKTKIFVGRLPEEAQSHDLRRLFERFGVVTECDILNRYGFVHMKTEDMALRAIEALHNADFMGVQISVEQSTGKKSGRGAGPIRGGGSFMRGRGGMSRGGPGGGRPGGPPPYMRAENGRGDYPERRPGPPPPSVRNGYYDSYDRGGGYDNYYAASRGPPPPQLPSRDSYSREPERRGSYSELMRSPYGERRSYPGEAGGRSPYDRPLPPPPVPTFERRSEYGASRPSADMYRRRSPPPQQSSYNGGGDDPFYSSRYERDGMDRMDPYGPPARRYPAPSPLDRGRELPPPRRF